MTTPLCQDCKHCERAKQLRTENQGRFSPAPVMVETCTRQPRPLSTAFRRKKGQACGPTAKLFEVKPEH